MNVCFIVYNLGETGGVNTMVLNLSNELSRNKQLKIFILDLNPLNELERNKLFSDIYYNTLPKSYRRYPIQFWFNLCPIYRFLKQNNIDIAFIEGTDAGFFAPILQLFVSSKFVFCDHGALCNQLDDKKQTFIRYMASKCCKHTIVLTRKTYIDYIRIFKIKEKKLSIIYNYVECELSDRYDIGIKKIMSIGRLTSEKGMDLLLKVAKIVLEYAPEWTWDVYGDGPLLQEMRDKAQEYNLHGQLRYLGGVENAAQYMSGYGIYVLPSYREGLPLVLIEATRNSLPMVSFDIDTGPRDIVVNGKTGFLIQPYDINKMAEKIILLIESEQMRSDFSRNCNSIIKKFDKEIIINQWMDLLNSISH